MIRETLRSCKTCYSLLQELNKLAQEDPTRCAQREFQCCCSGTPHRPFFDDFEVIREIGRGGMAIVYEAQQRTLGRRVALKVLPISMAMDVKKQRRFFHEAQAAAGTDSSAYRAGVYRGKFSRMPLLRDATDRRTESCSVC